MPASIARRIRILIIAATAATFLANGTPAQAASASPPVAQLQSDSPNRFGCHVNDDHHEDLCIDTNGNDAVDVIRVDSNGNGNDDVALVDSDHDGSFEWAFVNTDDDGTFDAAGLDADGDGKSEQTFRRGKDAWYPNANA